MTLLPRLTLVTLVAALAAGPALAQEPEQPAAPEQPELATPLADAPLGQRVELTFQDMRFLPRRLGDFGERQAYVLAFVTQRCPIANRYLPELQRIADDYAERGVEVVLVNVDFADSVLAIAGDALDKDVDLHVVKDSGSCAQALGITRTPEVAVLDAQHTLVYRGRIDDRVRLGGARPEPSRRDLRAALDELLAGEPISVATTPVDGCKLTPPRATPAHAAVTYSRDVAPIFQQHCVECHRKGGSAPFALTSYDDVWTLSDMIGEVVRDRRMPPWYATGGPDALLNHRGLSADELAVVEAWLDADAPEGDPADLPAPREFPTGRWAIGEPDLVLSMPEPIAVAADGTMPSQYVMLPHRFEADTWVEAVELVASQPEVMHHCNLFYVLPGQEFDTAQVLTGKVPGSDPMMLGPGAAALIPAGAILGLQIHYQPNGTAVDDTISVGIRFPRAPIQRRFRGKLIETKDFAIPPGARHHAVSASHTFEHDVIAVAAFGHMHLRGKDYTFTATVPNGEPQQLVRVPNYSFDWQVGYVFRSPKFFPKGTRVDVVAHYDNSRFNAYNPDPSATVGYGLQTDREMMYCLIYYVHTHEQLGLEVDPQTGVARAE